MTSLQAVMETTPANSPETSSERSIIYFRFFFKDIEKRTPETPPAIAPFIVTTATLLATFHEPKKSHFSNC